MESAYAGIGGQALGAADVMAQRKYAEERAMKALAAQSAQRDQSELEVVTSKLQSILQFASEQGSAIEQVCDKLTGGYPLAKEAGGGAVGCAGSIGTLNTLCDALMARLQMTSETVGRLRSAI